MTNGSGECEFPYDTQFLDFQRSLWYYLIIFFIISSLSPLTPDHAKELIDNFKGDNKLTNIYVQPSQRIFPDSQYANAGAIVTDDVTDADILLGVKRGMNEEDLIADKTYMFFSHVIKGQPENMPLLQSILDKNIQLFDYEAIAKDVKDPSTGEMKKQRTVAFGITGGDD